jgi:hypothetical protein
MLYNLLQITRQQIAAAQPIPCAAASLSTEEICRDVTRQLTAITELIRPTEMAHLIPLAHSRFVTLCELSLFFLTLRHSRTRSGKSDDSDF